MMKLLRVSPWDNLRLFQDVMYVPSFARLILTDLQHFVKRKGSSINPLTTFLTTVLAATLRCFTVRPRTTDSFNGEPVVKYLPPTVPSQDSVRYRATAKEQKASKVLDPPDDILDSMKLVANYSRETFVEQESTPFFFADMRITN